MTTRADLQFEGPTAEASRTSRSGQTGRRRQSSRRAVASAEVTESMARKSLRWGIQGGRMALAMKRRGWRYLNTSVVRSGGWRSMLSRAIKPGGWRYRGFL